MLTTEEFIERAKKIHGEKYDYSQTIFVNWKTKVSIRCPIHGPFLMNPAKHILGKVQGCKKCGQKAWAIKKNELARAAFIGRVEAIHGDKFDLSKVVYKNSVDKVTIICRKHGKFPISPSSLLRGNGCSLCGDESSALKRSKGTEKFIEEAIKVHGDRYDYSLVVYISSYEQVIIICHEHGKFPQFPLNHLKGHNCIECGFLETGNKLRMPLEEFIASANAVHSNKYDYSNVDYNGSKDDVEIICPVHGPFLQSPGNHIRGSGCKLCGDLLNSRGIQLIENWLKLKGLVYEREKTFDGFKSKKTKKQHFRFDFFVPGKNILIEFDGPQHFKPIEHWGGEPAFQALIENDKQKEEWAVKNGYLLLRIRFDELEKMEDILTVHINEASQIG
jgi:very-short-patch-repair endonuclease